MLYCASLHAQNLYLIKSLKSQINSTEGKKKFEFLNDLAWEYRWAYPDSTILYARKAFELGQQLKLEKDLARSLNFIGVANNYKGERLEAFENFNTALKMSIAQNDSSQIAYSNNNIGRLFFEQGLSSRSYEYFVRALATFQAINDLSGLAYTYQSLATLYASQKDYVKAESNYVKAYKIRLKLGDTRNISAALFQIGRLYQANKDHEKALRYFHYADSTARIINDAINLAEIKTFAAESYLSNGLLREAEAMCTEGLAYILKLQNLRMLPHAYITMGQIQIDKKEPVKAKHYFMSALKVSTQLKDLNSKMEAHYFLWRFLEKQNNKTEQLTNQNQYLIIKDSIKDLDLTRQVERLQFQIDIQRKEQENELLKANQAKNAAYIHQQRSQNIGLIVIVALVSTLGIVQWLNSKKRRQINEKLAEQNEKIQKQQEEIIAQNAKLSKHNLQLSDLNHEKDTIMSIVAHDLRSPLNRILGLTSLLEHDVNTNRSFYIKLLKEATASGLVLIKDLLDVHMLEENVEPDYSTFNISDFLLQKVGEFIPLAEAKGIHLKAIRVHSESISQDEGYLGRIVDNLLSNSIKFSKVGSSIELSAIKKDNYIIFSIKDQGPGFSDEDRPFIFKKFKKLSARPTAGETSNGLGLTIVKTLVDRLKGDIQLNTKQGEGSEFIIRLPANSPKRISS